MRSDSQSDRVQDLTDRHLLITQLGCIQIH